MRVFALIFSLLLASCGAQVTSQVSSRVGQPRIVSTSLCGDTYVLAVVAEADIAALSWQSGDAVSSMPARLGYLPNVRDDAEALLALNPTLVVFGPGEGAAAKSLLDKRGIKYVNLIWGEDFKSVLTNMNKLANVVHRDPSKINVIQRLPRNRPSVLYPSVLYLSAAGGTAGPGTYVDAAIKAAGGRNIITIPGWHTPQIETLVGLDPDLIVTSFFKDGYASVNGAGLRNKVLQDKIKAIPRVQIPGKLWPCAGPGLYGATQMIGRAIAELGP